MSHSLTPSEVEASLVGILERQQADINAIAIVYRRLVDLGLAPMPDVRHGEKSITAAAAFLERLADDCERNRAHLPARIPPATVTVPTIDATPSAWSTLLAELGLPADTAPQALARCIRAERFAIADALRVVREVLKPAGAYRLRHEQAIMRSQQILVDAGKKETPSNGQQS